MRHVFDPRMYNATNSATRVRLALDVIFASGKRSAAPLYMRGRRHDGKSSSTFVLRLDRLIGRFIM